MQKILPKTKFARLAGVNPSTVTRLCETILKRAMVGKRLDAAHPDAVEYLKSRERATTAPSSAEGVDPLYEEAIETCEAAGKYTATFVHRALKIGYGRAQAIVGMMADAGLAPDAPTPNPATKPVAKSEPKPKRPKPAAPKPKPAAKKDIKPVSTKENEIIEIPSDIQEFADMTLRDLIDKFGTDARFVDWLSATQKIEAINEKRLKNATTQGDLVSRYLVRVGVIEPIDAAHIKLLTDGSRTIAQRATAMHSAGRPLDDIEKFVADQITSFIRPVKAKVARALKNA